MSPGEGFAGDPDRRFEAEAWSQFPFNVYARAYQNNLALMNEAVRDVSGVTDYHAQLLEFAVRMLLDATSPSNYLASNPELLALTQSEQGQNLVRGFKHVVEDLGRTLKGSAPAGTEEFEVGKNVAVTPGKVVFRNELIELIQYEPATPSVYAEPVLIVPAWIMKYYILDLSPRNSMVKYLVEQGHTVFMMSWKNPDERTATSAWTTISKKGSRCGRRRRHHRAQTQDPRRGLLHRRHLARHRRGGAGARQGRAAGLDHDVRRADRLLRAGRAGLLHQPEPVGDARSHDAPQGRAREPADGRSVRDAARADLLWQPIVNQYLKGQRDRMIDLMAWNADGTRMPWRMHSEYLYRLYLDNELATNRFPVGGKLIRLSDISVPMFVVGTEADHVAPWKSVYKVDNLVRSDDLTFLLTAGGHNAGIVAGPVHPKRHYRIRTRRLAEPHLAPEDWMEAATKHDGSWWPAWQRWLAEHSSGKTKPPAMGAPHKGYRVIESAPGQYVRHR